MVPLLVRSVAEAEIKRGIGDWEVLVLSELGGNLGYFVVDESAKETGSAFRTVLALEKKHSWAFVCNAIPEGWEMVEVECSFALFIGQSPLPSQ